VLLDAAENDDFAISRAELFQGSRDCRLGFLVGEPRDDSGDRIREILQGRALRVFFGALSAGLSVDVLLRLRPWEARLSGWSDVTYRASIVDPDLNDHAPSLRSGENLFVRGNSNADNWVDISDGVFTLKYLFRGEDKPNCIADANGDGEVNLADPIFTFGFLFLGSLTIPEPFPQCGLDRRTIGLSCAPPLLTARRLLGRRFVVEASRSNGQSSQQLGSSPGLLSFFWGVVEADDSLNRSPARRCASSPCGMSS